MQVCEACGAEFPYIVDVKGVRLNVRGRKRCLDCLPHRPLRAPRRPVINPVSLRPCQLSGRLFPPRAVIEGRPRYLYRRRFCFVCSPFGQHNTSKSPLGISEPEELRALRRRRKNAQNASRAGDPVVEHRRRRKLMAIAHMGGRCDGCGTVVPAAAFEFHHRDAKTKEFGISQTGNPRRWEKTIAELAKCVLLCANCHREVHAGVRELFDDGLLGLAEEPPPYRYTLKPAGAPAAA